MTPSLAHYATNVHHYHFAVAALRAVYGEVSLSRRFELDQDRVDRLSRLIPAKSTRRLLARRVAEPDGADANSVLWLSSTWPALRARTGGRMGSREIRALTDASARAVARASQGARVLQFVEGLGLHRLRRERPELAVMERRNLHHAAFEGQVDVWGGFPWRPALDPIRDILEEEYQRSDQIVVYSNVARQSFLERGFDPERVHIVPLAGNRRPPSSTDRRDEHLAAYVGRGDAFKGLDLAVGVIEQLGAPFRLEVAGPMKPEVLSWLAQFERVSYRGILGRTELDDLYARSTLLLAPSVESFGLAMYDAASAGVRVIARETAGIAPELGALSVRVVSGRELDNWVQTVIEEFEAESHDRRRNRVDAPRPELESLTWARSESRLRDLHAQWGQRVISFPNSIRSVSDVQARRNVEDVHAEETIRRHGQES